MSLNPSLQLFPSLDPATEAALRASIRRFGVIQPVTLDQHGRIIDGNHRSAICAQEGIDCPTQVINVADDEHARALAQTLNLDRRHLDADQRRQLVAALRSEGHSLRAIAGALGVSAPTVLRDARSIVTPETMPDRVRTSDGRSYPARQSERTVPDVLDEVQQQPELAEHLDDVVDAVFDAIEDTEPALQAEAAACAVDEMRRHYEDEPNEDCPPPFYEEATRPAIVKPDLGGGISHPARFSAQLFPIFRDLLAAHLTIGRRILDPFAGTGGIHQLSDHGYETVGVELEPEWSTMHPGTMQGDATDLPFDPDSFDAVVTSPTYGNRLADSYASSDPHLRRSYRFDLGRELSGNNSGAMQWGDDYRALHEKAWQEAHRVVRPGGLLLLNIKDHVRAGEQQYVAGWHVTAMCRIGFDLLEHQEVATPSLRQGTNSDLRCAEQVYAFRKLVR